MKHTEIRNLLVRRAERAERHLADTIKVADMVEEMCDKEIEKLKARIRELEIELEGHLESHEEHIEDEDGSIAHMKMVERLAEDAYHRSGADREDPSY
tara:strand:+ start:156 stop:449 length:294 start_codon:yes stop_codon:yes gene_type:complete